MTNIKDSRERLKTDSVQALLTTVNETVSKWEAHFEWQTPQDKKTKKTQLRLNQISKKAKQNKSKGKKRRDQDQKEEAETNEKRLSTTLKQEEG